MKKITKLCIGLTALVGAVSPITLATSCGNKEEPKPTEETNFTATNVTMNDVIHGTMDLNWTPNGNNVEISNPTFKYYGDSKSANVELANTSNGAKTLKVNFTSSFDDNITDGKLSFHYKDLTTQKEGDKTITDIKANVYLPEGGYSVSLEAPDNSYWLHDKDKKAFDGKTYIAFIQHTAGHQEGNACTITKVMAGNNDITLNCSIFQTTGGNKEWLRLTIPSANITGNIKITCVEKKMLSPIELSSPHEISITNRNHDPMVDVGYIGNLGNYDQHTREVEITDAHYVKNGETISILAEKNIKIQKIVSATGTQACLYISPEGANAAKDGDDNGKIYVTVKLAKTTTHEVSTSSQSWSNHIYFKAHKTLNEGQDYINTLVNYSSEEEEIKIKSIKWFNEDTWKDVELAKKDYTFNHITGELKILANAGVEGNVTVDAEPVENTSTIRVNKKITADDSQVIYSSVAKNLVTTTTYTVIFDSKLFDIDLTTGNPIIMIPITQDEEISRQNEDFPATFSNIKYGDKNLVAGTDYTIRGQDSTFIQIGMTNDFINYFKDNRGKLFSFDIKPTINIDNYIFTFMLMITNKI